ncbi:MAG: tetratricopeptide repeat protein, partial [Thermodesulfobacteriota bacterium]
ILNMIKRLFFIIISFFFLLKGIGFTIPMGEDEKLLLVGTGAFKDGFYDIAEKEFSQFIKEYPSHPNIYEVYYLLGKTQILKGKWQEARSVFLKILNEQKNFEHMNYNLFWLASTELKVGSLQKAKRFLLDLLKLFPKFERIDLAYYLLGHIEFELGNLSSSENYFQKASFISKMSEILKSSFFWLGLCSFRKGRYEEASGYFNKIIEGKGKAPSLLLRYALFWLGEAQLKSGQFEEAKRTYQAFFDRYRNDPLSAEAFWKSGFCHYRLGETQEALRLFQSFRMQYKNSPLLPYTQFLTGKMLLSQGDYSSSLKEFDSILNKSPETPLWGLSLTSIFWNQTYQGNVEATHKISQRLQRMTHFEEEKVFLQWIQGEMTFAEGRIADALPYYFNILNTRFREKALFQIGKGYFFENKFRDALTNLDILLFEYPNSRYIEEALFLKGESLLRTGDLDRALECYGNILKNGLKTTWDLLALTQIGNLFSLLKETQKAEKTFKKILQEFPDHPLTYYALFQLGNLNFRKNNIVEAIHYYSQILKGSQLELWGETYFLLGEIFYQQGKYEKALGSFEMAIRYLKETSPWFFLTYIELGNLQRKWGKVKEAKKSFTTVLNQTRDEDLKKAASELLNLIEKH